MVVVPNTNFEVISLNSLCHFPENLVILHIKEYCSFTKEMKDTVSGAKSGKRWEEGNNGYRKGVSG